ncbi:MAG: hypothetical protein ACLUGQ_00520 [Coprococcus sp.]
MNNEKILKKKIQQYLLMPLALTVLLVGMVIVLYVHDKKSGAIAAAAVFIFVVCEIIFFIVMKAAIMPVVFRFALEQGQIQKELLKELDIPYALLDTDGKILWGNAKFIEEIGVGSKKRIRKNISAFFPAVDAEALSSEEMQMDLEYNDRVYRALLRRIDFSEALVDSDEDAMVDHQADAMITLYLYDETDFGSTRRKMKTRSLSQDCCILIITMRLWRIQRRFVIRWWKHWLTDESTCIFPRSTRLERSWRRINISSYSGSSICHSFVRQSLRFWTR